MTDSGTSQRYRFGVFEADVTTGELRKHGVRIKLNAQPFQVLILLLDRPGEVLTREQIYREFWPDGTFVDSEHGVNSAVNRLRDALGDTASNPRFVETLSRRGYRFVAPVERIEPGQVLSPRRFQFRGRRGDRPFCQPSPISPLSQAPGFCLPRRNFQKLPILWCRRCSCFFS